MEKEKHSGRKIREMNVLVKKVHHRHGHRQAEVKAQRMAPVDHVLRACLPP